MTPKVAGGHCISLRVRIPDELVKVAADWVAARPDVRKLKIRDDDPFELLSNWHGHVTLVFVGRDKKPEVGEKMLEVARNNILPAPYMPRAFRSDYSTTIMGYHGDHLVTPIYPGDRDQLSLLAQKARGHLVEAGVKPKDDFAFNPHVTLATGEKGLSVMQLPKIDELYWLQVEGLEVKIGSDRTELIKL